MMSSTDLHAGPASRRPAVDLRSLSTGESSSFSGSLLDEMFGHRTTSQRDHLALRAQRRSPRALFRAQARQPSTALRQGGGLTSSTPDEVLVPFEEIALARSGATRTGRRASGQDEMPACDGTATSRRVGHHTLNAMSAEHLGYPTQKPEALLERIIEGDLPTWRSRRRLLLRLRHHCCGRREARPPVDCLRPRPLRGPHDSQAADGHRELQAVRGPEPRQVRAPVLADRRRSTGETRSRSLFEYLAFILKLYGAEPVAGMQHIHGKKGGAVVHVGAVDAPGDDRRDHAGAGRVRRGRSEGAPRSRLGMGDGPQRHRRPAGGQSGRCG